MVQEVAFSGRVASARGLAPGTAPPVQLRLAPTPPGGIFYQLVSYWEERCRTTVQRNTLTKTITLDWVRPTETTAQLTYRATAPVWQKPATSVLERALLLLADLYKHLELAATPAGRPLALRNHADLLATWQQVQAELVRRSGGEDEITQILLTSLAARLQQPATVLASLRYDYAFAFLIPDFYEQPFAMGHQYEQSREFPHFFADTNLWFRERLEVVAPAPDAAGRYALHLRGRLDEARTDLPAVARRLNEALEAAGQPSLAPTTALQATFEATCLLDAATGWPLQTEVVVRCEAGGDYSKEYFLRLEQLPSA